jgi:hypothetical protein
MGNKSRLAPFWSMQVGTIIGLVANIVINIAAGAAILGLLDVTQSNVRVFSLVVSSIVGIYFIAMLIYRYNDMRKIYLSAHLPTLRLEIELVGYWVGTIFYVALSLLFAILHFRSTATDAFNPVVNPGPYARLLDVINGYWILSLAWIATSILIFFPVKGTDDRRKYIGMDSAKA